MLHSAVFKKGAGTGHGEPTEQHWAAHGENGKVDQYKTVPHYMSSIEARAAQTVKKLDDVLAPTLVRMAGLAIRREQEATADATGVLRSLEERGVSADEVRVGWLAC